MNGLTPGVSSPRLLRLGASAVAVGTANFYEPQTALRVIAGLQEFMRQRSIGDVHELIGSVRTGK